jgi:hypothetical protein
MRVKNCPKSFFGGAENEFYKIGSRGVFIPARLVKLGSLRNWEVERETEIGKEG